MDFQDGLKVLSEKILKFKDQVPNEEATKTAFIMPFFDLLGYDTRNPIEFVPEFTADIGLKKGEKVDYAIFLDGTPIILIEAKSCTVQLDNHDDQLLRYFHTSKAKIGILTNGIIYKFYTDLDEPNKMDSKPFLEINLLGIKDNEINELKKFFKSNFDMTNILSTAEELKYSNAIKKVFQSQIETPDETFIDFFTNLVYEGKKTKAVKEKFSGLVQKSINEVLNDIVRTKLENALNTKQHNITSQETAAKDQVDETVDKLLEQAGLIVTTDEEIQGYNIIRSILSEIIDINRITYKDTVNYMNTLLDGRATKWVVRMYLNSKTKYISFPLFEGVVKEERVKIDKIEDLFKYRDRIKEVALKLV